MREVRLVGVTPAQAIDLKNDLVAAGLTLNQDFVWWYKKPHWDNFSFDGVYPSAAVFKFRDEQLATFYQLKWQ